MILSLYIPVRGRKPTNKEILEAVFDSMEIRSPYDSNHSTLVYKHKQEAFGGVSNAWLKEPYERETTKEPWDADPSTIMIKPPMELPKIPEEEKKNVSFEWDVMTGEIVFFLNGEEINRIDAKKVESFETCKDSSVEELLAIIRQQS